MPASGLIALILMVAFPLLELAILIKAGSAIGVLPTLAIVIGTAIVGLTVFRQQGAGIARRAFEQARTNAPPVVPMIESGLLAIAGGLLIAPGLITDFLGLLLLIPPMRQLIARRIAARGNIVVMAGSGRRRDGGPQETIEGDFERLDERDVPRRRPTIDQPD